jgi:uncharacterized protein YaiE (UPF0345 family)
MTEDRFENVVAVKKANVYYEGRVTSRTINFPDGSRKTLGFMLAGEYTFETAGAEIMEMLNGEMTVLLPGSSEWQTVGAGESFSVPAASAFQVKIASFADYCCSYA